MNNPESAPNIPRKALPGRPCQVTVGGDVFNRDYENSHEEFRNTPAEEVFMVSTFMNKEPRTITEDTDFLSIAEIFLNTNNRRLPVLHEGELIGQISRRDLLQATYEMAAVPLERDSSLLYLSALVERRDAPVG